MDEEEIKERGWVSKGRQILELENEKAKKRTRETEPNMKSNRRRGLGRKMRKKKRTKKKMEKTVKRIILMLKKKQ